MAVLTHTVLGSHRRVFQALVVFWMMLLGTTLLVVLLMPAKPANAAEALPIPKIAREMAEPAYLSLAEISQVPTQGLGADRCQSYLKSVRQNYVQDNRSENASSNPARRPAGTSARMTSVEAIKAYRQCKSQTALQELATWRWSR